MLIEAPLEVVWGVLTESAQISRWFSDVAEVDLRPGGRGAFSWEEHGTVDWAEEEKADYLEGHTRGWNRHLHDLGVYTAQQHQASAR